MSTTTTRPPTTFVALPPVEWTPHKRECPPRESACREFTPAHKDAAVKLVINTGRAVATVARELGINEASLGLRVSVFSARNDIGETAVPEPERAELLRLRKEIADLSLDRAYLQKRPSSSLRRRRMETKSVRPDARREDQFQRQPNGPIA